MKDKKSPVSGNSESLNKALSQYAGRMIGDLGPSITRFVKEAISEALASNAGPSMTKMMKVELKNDGSVESLEARNTFQTGDDVGVFNPAAENRVKQLTDEAELTKAGYVDEKAKARKEFYRQKNGG
jgi:hypothetical protein